jgi:hypothetical protein
MQSCYWLITVEERDYNEHLIRKYTKPTQITHNNNKIKIQLRRISILLEYQKISCKFVMTVFGLCPLSYILQTEHYISEAGSAPIFT